MAVGGEGEGGPYTNIRLTLPRGVSRKMYFQTEQDFMATNNFESGAQERG